MKYSKAQVSLHWITVVLLIGMAGSGLAYSYDWADDGVLDLHQVVGQALIVTLVLRIALRLVRPPQATPPLHAAWERALAHAVHIGLYLCLVAFVATGYVAASGLGTPALLAPLDKGFARSDLGETLLEAHYTLKWVLLGLFVLHIAGVLKHAVLDRDATLSHMRLPRSSKRETAERT